MGSLSNVLEKIFLDNGRIDLLVLAQIKKVISNTLPESISKYIEVYKFSNGKLYIKSSHSIWSSELKFNKDMIINKLNEQLGKEMIKDLRIK